MKEWLNQHGYSWEAKDRSHRVLFTLRRGQEEVVVVEGRSAPDKVGVITVFGASAGLEFNIFGHQFDTAKFAVDGGSFGGGGRDFGGDKWGSGICSART